MSVEMWTLWVAVLVQIASVTVLARRVRERDRILSKGPDVAANGVTSVLDMSLISIVSEPALSESQLDAYLFVSPSCQTCKRLLDEVPGTIFEGFRAALIFVLRPGEERQNPHHERTCALGMGVGYTSVPGLMGVREVPSLIVAKSSDKTVVIRTPMHDAYELEAVLAHMRYTQPNREVAVGEGR